MEYFVSDKVGRTFILKLTQGDDALESIQRLVEENHIENAVVLTGIATFDKSRLHMISTTDYPIGVDIEERENVPLEVAGIDGFICDGEPHIHCVIANKYGACAGHMLTGCRILYLGEIVIQELFGLNIHRHLTEKGANHIFEKEEV